MSPKYWPRKGEPSAQATRAQLKLNQSKQLRRTSRPVGSQAKTPRSLRVKRTRCVSATDRPACALKSSTSFTPLVRSAWTRSIADRPLYPRWKSIFSGTPATGGPGLQARPRAVGRRDRGIAIGLQPASTNAAITSAARSQGRAPCRSSAKQPRPRPTQGDEGTTSSGRPSRRAWAAALRAPLRRPACTTTTTWESATRQPLRAKNAARVAGSSSGTCAR